MSSHLSNSNHIMANYWDTVGELCVFISVRERQRESVRVGGEGKQGKHRALSALVLCVICLSVITFRARSIQRRRPAEHHTPKWSLTSSLCGELGPVAPNLISVCVSRLPARSRCSGNIQLVRHELTKANVSRRAWRGAVKCLVEQSSFNNRERFDQGMMPVILCLSDLYQETAEKNIKPVRDFKWVMYCIARVWKKRCPSFAQRSLKTLKNCGASIFFWQKANAWFVFRS